MNKTITKRLLSLVLLVVMLVGCALPAYAMDTGASGDLTAAYALRGTAYKDGVYEGTGKGFKDGEIKVKVTITDGKIAKVELVSQEKQSYWDSKNVSSLFDEIVKANSTEIDGVSGATMSSNGVKAAVNDALSKALVTAPEQPGGSIFAAGTGAKSDPYLIRTVDQLKAFAASVNGGETYASQYVTLDADLDLTGESWTPIGGDNGSFNGSFNGDNHTIAGLAIGTKAESAACAYAGLFGLVGQGGAIRNLGVKDAFINNKTTDEDPAVGILAAATGESSVIDGCWVSGTIVSDAAGDNNYTYVGGVVGNGGGKSLVCNTWADVQIAAKGSDTGAGGIVGWTSNDSAVINCAAFGTIGNYCDGSMMYGAGGIVGYSCGAIYACYSDVTLHMDAMSDAGDGSDVPIGGIAGSPAALTAAYRCWFNADATQTYYGDEAVAEPVAVGYDMLNYSVSDQEECAGLTSAELTSGVLATKLADALTEEKLADAQAYFSDKAVGLLGNGVTMNSLLSMSENGWNSWQVENGRLLPTGEGSNQPVDPSDFFAGGEGTQADPYRIETEAQLRGFAEATQSGKLSTTNLYIRLDADIALSEEAWTPIAKFGGSFDGDGHTVSGMTIGTSAQPSERTSAGFFETLANGASVSNLKLTDVSVNVARTGSSLDDAVYAGGLVGGGQTMGADVRIDNCSVTGGTISASSGMHVYAGGLAARLGGTNYVTNCYADIDITAASSKYVASAGGLVGTFGSSSFVGNCAALGAVAASGNSQEYNRVRAGGLLASAPFLTENCYASGNVTLTNASSDYDAYAGTLIGEQSGSAVVDSHYSSKAVLTVNGESKDLIAVGKTPSSWYSGINYNKITAQDDVTNDVFAAVLNQGISAEGLAATDEYLINSGKFSGYTAEGLAAMRPAVWQRWGAADGKVLPGVKAKSIFASGTGTKDDPFVIETEAQLRAFAASTIGDNAVDYAGQYVALDADITLNGAWTPIHYFAGSFDGRGHTVSGVRIGTELAPLEQSSVGFFDVLSNGASLANLHLTNVAVYGKLTGDWDRPFVGGLVGGSLGMGKNARIDHCSVAGGIVSAEGRQWAYGGGLTASLYLDAYLTNSWTDVTVQVKSANGLCSAGGLVATNSNGTMIANCAALGGVTAISGYTTSSKVSASVGGLVGQGTGMFHNCYAAGNVALTMAITPDEPAVGSLIGQMSTSRSYNGIVTDCYYNSKATVTVNGTAGTAVAFGDLVSGDTNNVAGADTSSAAFADTMNRGLTVEGLAATDKFLTSNDIGFTTDMLIAMRPAAWYGWEVRNGKTVLGADVFVQPDAPVLDFFERGSGTEAAPWVIQNLDQLKAFAASFAKTDYSGKYIVLGADIDLAGEAWTPIGHMANGTQAFRGSFDGQGHKISNMTIGSKAAPVSAEARIYFGLFAALMNGSVVENLGLENVNVHLTADKESAIGGALAGCCDLAVINNCWATGDITARTEDGSYANNSFAGGLIGYSQRSYILNSWTDVTLDAFCKTANAEAGGITAMNAFGMIVNCYTLGDISGETDRENVDDGGVTYLGGIAGCQAGTIANCYTTSNLTSRSWTRYVGAIAGMATAISESYDTYFSDGARLTIKDQTFDPPVAFGSQVPSGYNEDGEFMNGSFVSNVEALPAGDMTAQALADKLNGNFGAFPISEDDLPAALRTWTIQNGAVVFGTGTASITYVPVERPDPSINYDYKDGTYYGRDTDKKVIVRITVKDKKIVSAEVVDPANFDAANSETILAALIKDQTVKNASDGTTDDQTLKAALSVAVNKALLGDTSTYDLADPSTIFAGGTGTQNDPYQIATAAQLRAFAAAVNEEEHFDGEYIVLTADIDLSDAQWMPVGSAGGHYFAGIFDGQNHCIRGMKIGTQETPADYVSAGLFACIDGAVVRNLAVADAEIYIARPDAVRTYAGIIAGVTDNSETGAGAVINNCAVSGTIYNKSVDWSQNGGITAYCYNSMILNCGAQVDITSISTGGTALAGGIVGQDGFAIVANNYARGSIYAEAGVNSATIGGIAGMQAGVAGNNYADVKLVSKNATGDIGGITGRNTAIGTIIYGYFNSEQEQRSGNTVIAEPKAVGENVTMLGNTGVVKETAGMTAAELKSEAFRDLLNDNQCEDKELRTALAQGISDFNIVVREAKLTIDSWVLDGIVRQGNAPALAAPQPAAAPVIDPKGGSFIGEQTVTITCETEGARIYYTTDGSDPTADSTLYTGAFTLTESATVKAIAVKDGCPASEIVTATFTKAEPAAAPVIDPNGGSFTGEQTVTITCETEGARIYYTTDGSDPTANSTLYTGAFTLTASATVKAVAVKDGCPASEIVTAVFTKAKPAIVFDDVAKDAWYYDAVQWAVGAGVTEGTGNNHFSPNMICTRAQAVMFLWNAAGNPTPKTTDNPFVDVSENVYYYQAMLWAAGEGITEGTGNNCFSPNMVVTRSQIVSFLYRYAGSPAVENAASFADVPATAYYADAVAWAMAEGVTEGTGNNCFSPLRDCTRAEMVCFLFNYFAK